MKGLSNGEIVVNGGAPYLNDGASIAFTHQVSSLLIDPAHLSMKPKPGTVTLNPRFDPEAAAIIRELNKELVSATSIIDAKYASVAAHLGSPLTTMATVGAHFGFYRSYERGAIYLAPKSQIAFEVHGAIYQKYRSLRAEAGILGYPITDQDSTTLGTAQMNHFKGGTIYWTPSTGAWEIHGAIRERYLQLFADRSWLGFPVSDEENWASGAGTPIGRLSHFQYGILAMRWDTSEVFEISDALLVGDHIENDLVKADFQLGLNSKGDWYFSGHMHNDGLAGCVAVVVSFAKMTDAQGRTFAVSAERSLGGTFDGEDRNDDWSQSGIEDEFIRDNWALIRSAGIRTQLKSNTTVGDVLAAAIPIGTIALMIIGGAAETKICPPQGSIKRDPITGEDQKSVRFKIVLRDQPCPPDPLGTP